MPDADRIAPETGSREKLIGADEKLRKIKPTACRNLATGDFPMPSFDIVSEIDKQEIDNALNQARKELATRFDFKGSVAEIEYEKDKITLTAEDASRLRGLREIVIGKLSKRGIDLRNIDQEEPAISSIGHARQELKIQQGLEGDKAKEIILAIKGGGFKVQNQLQDRQIRVTGKKARRAAGSDRVCEEQRLRRRDQFQELPRLAIPSAAQGSRGSFENVGVDAFPESVSSVALRDLSTPLGIND